MLGLCLEQSRRLGQSMLQLQRVTIRRWSGERFDAPYTGRGAGLMGKTKERHLAGRPHMRAAAELDRYAGNIDDAHDVAVLLAEESHRAGRDGVLVCHLPRLDRQILPHVRIYLGLDRGELFALDRTMVAEIEAKPLGRD